MPVLPLPCPPAKLLRASPVMQPARSQPDGNQCAWLPAPHSTAHSLTTAAAARSAHAPTAAAAVPPAAALATQDARPVKEAHAAQAIGSVAVQRPSAAIEGPSSAHVALDGHVSHSGPSSNGQVTSPPTGPEHDDAEDGAPWRVWGRASSYSAPETQQAPALPPPPKLLVFSGGTAFNSVAGAVSVNAVGR